jgi:hypothetical protein
MTLKYRVQKIEIPGETTVFVAQYRILGIWMNIGLTRGHFLKECDTQCYCLLEVKDRIKRHKNLMSRSGKWAERKITNIYNYN